MLAATFWNYVEILSGIGGVCPAGVFVVSQLCVGGRWCIGAKIGGVSVASGRCSMRFWVFCSCFGSVSVVPWQSSGGALVVLKEWYFLD